MKILVSCIPYDGGRSGISEYVRQTVRSLAGQGHDLTLLCEPGADPGADAGIRAARVEAPRWTRRPMLSMLWHLAVLPFLILVRRKRYDGFFICAANRRACAFHPLRTVATVHDLANFHVPGKYSRLRMFYLAHILPFFAKRAHSLVAISETTKADMARFWRCAPERITVLYNGLPDCARPAPASTAGARRTILYISRIEHPGKNHVRLIRAYGMLPGGLAAEHPLVLAGADWDGADAVHATAAASPRAGSISMPGFVPAAEMEKLWSEAVVYVFPSLYEGFGLSLAEAMARGIPCACPADGALGEIAGDAAVHFDPASERSIAATLETLLRESPDERRARVERGLARAKRFSWRDHAAGIIRLLEAGK